MGRSSTPPLTTQECLDALHASGREVNDVLREVAEFMGPVRLLAWLVPNGTGQRTLEVLAGCYLLEQKEVPRGP